eukprot:UN25897
MKAEMLLFSNLKPRRLPKGLFQFAILTFFKNLLKIQHFQINIELPEAFWVSDLKKERSQLHFDGRYVTK